MKRLIVLAVLFWSATAQAGTKSFCIVAEGILPGNGVGGSNSATPFILPATSSRAASMVLQYADTGTQNRMIRMFFPPDAASVDLTPQVTWRAAATTGSVEWDVGFQVQTPGSTQSAATDIITSGTHLSQVTANPAGTTLQTVETIGPAIHTLDAATNAACANVAACGGQMGRPMYVTLARKNGIGSNMSGTADVTAFCFQYTSF